MWVGYAGCNACISADRAGHQPDISLFLSAPPLSAIICKKPIKMLEYIGPRPFSSAEGPSHVQLPFLHPR